MADTDTDWRALREGCERWLTNRPRSAAQILQDAADAVAADERPDHYGTGPIVEEFEAELAQRLGQEAAALMPSGTMAQQIALRVHCAARGRDTVAYHPTCHLELWEHGGLAQLHGLKAELVGDRDGLIELADLQALPRALGALLLELPQREIGGRLPEWDALQAQLQWARERDIALHLDGARIWEAAPFYARTPAEVAGGFDSVYTSLYKGLGGTAGCVLAGSTPFVEEARIWRRRHGGTLYHLFPLLAAARAGLRDAAPRMGEFHEHARAVAAALARLPGVHVVPAVPQTPMFHLHLPAEPDALWAGVQRVARTERVWLAGPPQASLLPGYAKLELSLNAESLAIAPEEVAALFAAVLDDTAAELPSAS